MENDDMPVGRILSRREVLALMGAAGAAMLVGGVSSCVFAETSPNAAEAALPSCVVTLE